MKLKSLACLLLAALASHFALADQMMFWEVDDAATIDGKPIRDFLDAYQATIPDWDDYNDWFAARVQVTDDSGSEPIYLENLINFDNQWQPFFANELGVPLDDTGNGWGTGHLATQSPIYGYDLAITENAVFTMQIGYAHYDEAADEDYWTTLADSTPEVNSLDFQNAHMYEQGSIAPSGHSPWNPTTFTSANPPAEVPEPATDILALLGAAVLVLKRRASR